MNMFALFRKLLGAALFLTRISYADILPITQTVVAVNIPVAASETVYVVHSGDTFLVIAQCYGVTVNYPQIVTEWR